MDNPQFTYLNTTFTAGSFWDRRRRVVRNYTIPHQLRMLRETGRYDAFDLKWNPIYDDYDPKGFPTLKHLFWDSDVGKWIEGASYFLQEEEGQSGCRGSAEIGKAIDELVGKIEKAQQKDGYLNIHYQVVEPGKRFTNLRDRHELYVISSTSCETRGH